MIHYTFDGETWFELSPEDAAVLNAMVDRPLADTERLRRIANALREAEDA